MKALVGAFNQEKALVGAFSVIVQPVLEPMEHYTALHWTLTMWKYSFVASNCPGHHPAGAGAGVAVTFSWQLAAAGLQLVSPHSPLPRHGDWTGSCRLVTTAAHWEKGWKEVPQYWSPGPFGRTTLFLGVDATQFSISHLNFCHLNMLRLFFK